MTLTQGESEVWHSIKRVSTNQDSRFLGVHHLSPVGDFSQPLQVTRTKADHYALRLKSPKLTANVERIFHRMIYTPAMKYCLLEVDVDEEFLAPVQSLVLAAILNSLGVARTLPTSIRHGSLSMGGLELLDLQTEAGISAIKLLNDSIFAMSETGKTILLNLYYSQVELGIGEPLLSISSIAISYLTPTWMTSVSRQFISQHNIPLFLRESFEPPLRHHRDRCIMDADHLTHFTPTENLISTI